MQGWFSKLAFSGDFPEPSHCGCKMVAEALAILSYTAKKHKKEWRSSARCPLESHKPDVCHMGNPNRVLIGPSYNVCLPHCSLPFSHKGPAFLSSSELRASLKYKVFPILLTQCQDKGLKHKRGGDICTTSFRPPSTQYPSYPSLVLDLSVPSSLRKGIHCQI